MKQRILAIVLAFVLIASLSAVCVYAADDDNTETGGGFLASVRDTLNNANADSDTDGSSASGKKAEDVQDYILDVGMLVVDGIVSYEEWEEDPKAVITRYSISLSLNEDGTGYMKNATDEAEITWDDDYITIEGESVLHPLLITDNVSCFVG